MFWDGDPATLDGKARAAFRSGFLGLGSFGWSTLARWRRRARPSARRRSRRWRGISSTQHGAPDIEAARAAAQRGDRVSRVAVRASARHRDRPAADGRGRRRGARALPHASRPTLEPEANTFAQGCVLPIGIAREDGEATRERRSISSAISAAGRRRAKEPAMSDFWLSVRPSAARPQRAGPSRRHRRVPEALSRAARAGAARGGLRGRARAACAPACRAARARRRRRTIAAIADADARENWRCCSPSAIICCAHPIARGGLSGADAQGRRAAPRRCSSTSSCTSSCATCSTARAIPFVLRAGELFFRPQRLTREQGGILLADEEMVDGAEQPTCTPPR